MRGIRKLANISEIAAQYDTYFFDLDGVIWTGDDPIQRNVDGAKYLQSLNKRVLFISNSSAKAVDYIVNRLRSYDIKVEEEHVYTSGKTMGIYIKEFHPEVKKILVFGTSTLTKELAKQSFHVEHVTESGEMTTQIFKQMSENLDKTVDALVVGVDYNMNFKKLALASLYIQSGIRCFATNKDRYIQVAGKKLPGAGTSVIQIEYATNTTINPIGKPNPYILLNILDRLKLDPKRCLMVGDNLYTDIEFGNKANIDTICTLTGVTSNLTEIEEAPESNRPTYYCDSL